MITTRRQFVTRTSAGLLATCFGPGLARANTYYDVNPWSPSGRFLAVTRFPFQDRTARLGDVAEACVIDLENQTLRSLYSTRAWGYQLGAILEWGDTDDHLYTNDVLADGTTVCVQIDCRTGVSLLYSGAKYSLSADATFAVAPDMAQLNRTQYAYGPPAADPDHLPPLEINHRDQNGLWRLDLATDRQHLALNYAAAVAVQEDPSYYDGGGYTFFHTKISPDNREIMLVGRCTFPEHITKQDPAKRGRNTSLMVAGANGGDLRLLVSRRQWDEGGHHPNWHPNSRSLIMNLTPTWLGEPAVMRFCQFGADGSDFRILSSTVEGSGHPSIDPTGRFLLADAYPMEKQFATTDGEVPIRLLDLTSDEEQPICHIFTDVGRTIKSRRYWGASKLDAHPVWSRDGRQVCFNGAPEGSRQVFIADLNGVLG